MGIDRRTCVYTVLLGDYEALNEQPVAKNSQVDFICFTDNPSLTSQSWKLVNIELLFPMDAPRSSRLFKICPHRFLKDYEISLYIDNSIILKKTPEVLLAELFDGRDVTMVCFRHSYRETVLDEFIEVVRAQLDDLNTVQEQLNTYSLTDPDVLKERPYMNGFIIRAHNDPEVIEVMENWMAQVLRYSRRDQLSLNYVLRRKKPTIATLETDFFNSEYFQWPVTPGRKREEYKHGASVATLFIDKITQKEQAVHALSAELAKQEQTVQALSAELAQKEREIRVLSAELAEIRLSRAWKLIQPLRRLRSWLMPSKSLLRKT